MRTTLVHTYLSLSKNYLSLRGELSDHLFFGEADYETLGSVTAHMRNYGLGIHSTQTRKLPIPVRRSAVPVLVPVLVQAAPYSIIY